MTKPVVFDPHPGRSRKESRGVTGRYFETGAVLSQDARYRYTLWRRWCSGPAMMVIGLNPSTANADEDDPTIRRCVAFANREGCGALAMGNLFALRATNPKALLHASNPVGPENERWLRYLGVHASVVVAAWGAAPIAKRQGVRVTQLFESLECFGRTKSGAPRHPLYLRADTPLSVFENGARP